MHKYLLSVQLIVVVGVLGACTSGSSLPVAKATPSAAPLISPSPVPSDFLRTAAYPPQCPVGAPDVPVCTVNVPSGTTPANTYTASGNEYILLRAGWSDPQEQSCNAFASYATTTFKIDGAGVAAVAVPCQLVPAGGAPANLVGQWFTDRRYLSPPLAPGRHTISVTYAYTANIPGACANQATDTPACSPKAGTGQTFTKTLIVS
jgi:hypothetical protein